MQINIIVVNDMCQLDTTGAFEVLVRIPGWTVDLDPRAGRLISQTTGRQPG